MEAATQARWETTASNSKPSACNTATARAGWYNGMEKPAQLVIASERDWEQLSLHHSSNCSPSVFFPAHRWRPGRAAVGRMFARLDATCWSLATPRCPRLGSPMRNGRLGGPPEKNLSPSLDSERKRRLNRLGFAFKKDIDRPKNEMARVLSATPAFQAQYGTAACPTSTPDNPSLGKWVSWQRKQQGQTFQGRRQKLEAFSSSSTLNGARNSGCSGSACTATESFLSSIRPPPRTGKTGRRQATGHLRWACKRPGRAASCLTGNERNSTTGLWPGGKQLKAERRTSGRRCTSNCGLFISSTALPGDPDEHPR